MKVAVTGASGHIGFNLVKKLVELNYNVKTLVHRNSDMLDTLNVAIINGSLLDPNSLIELCRDVEVVIHLAAIISIGSTSEDIVRETNVVGTKNLVEAAIKSGVRRIIHFSSIHALVHEPYDIIMDEKRELALDSKIPYEKSKATAEQWVLEQQSDRLDIVVLNPTSVIGPDDHGPSLMGEFMCGAYKGTIPAVVPGGYDWVDVRDVVDATISTIKNGRGGNRYILSGNWLSVDNFAKLYLSKTDKKKKLPLVPLWLARIGVPTMYVFAKLTRTKPVYTNESLTILQSGNRNISSEKANKELGFTTRPLETTLADTYHWYKENNYI